MTYRTVPIMPSSQQLTASLCVKAFYLLAASTLPSHLMTQPGTLVIPVDGTLNALLVASLPPAKDVRRIHRCYAVLHAHL